ncbi:MAG TPA: hypothetical protein VHT21_19220 [Stellaceae bacterium]|jgi:hypothetical protein|nr:hypothetical protein [Stellaceae bacterium]
MWLIELSGDHADIEELKKLAQHCQCEIAPDHNGREYLSGSGFENLSSAEEVRAAAIKVLTLLNGIARISCGQFRPVQFAGVSQIRPDCTKAAFAHAHATGRARASADAVVIRAEGTVEPGITPITPDLGTQRAKQIIAEPKLREIAEAIAGEITWQRLRVAFERICALVSKRSSKGAWDNALVKNGYATPDELTRLKANMEDPRISGLHAVHGVGTGPGPKGTKMTEQQGLEFVLRLLNTYLDSQPR